MLRARAFAAPSRAPRRAGRTRTLGGEEAAGGRKGGAEGWAGMGVEGALVQGPGPGKAGERTAGDAANFSANCRAQPAPPPGHPPTLRREMLMPRSCRGRGRAPGAAPPSQGVPRRRLAAGGEDGDLGAPSEPGGLGNASLCPPSPGRWWRLGAPERGSSAEKHQ